MMGDGFVEMDMGRGGKYEVMMQKAMDSFFSVEPMHSLREYFDVYSVTLVAYCLHFSLSPFMEVPPVKVVPY